MIKPSTSPRDVWNFPKSVLDSSAGGNQVNPVFRQHRTDHGVFCGHHLPQASGPSHSFGEKNTTRVMTGRSLSSGRSRQELSPAAPLMILVLPVDSGSFLYLPCILQCIVEQVSHRGRIVNLFLGLDAKEQVGRPFVLHSRQALNKSRYLCTGSPFWSAP